jgi:putative holliday junction resolvase
MTTMAATRALRDSGQKTRNSRGVVDQVAAQMILQGYLDALQSARSLDEEAGAPQND